MSKECLPKESSTIWTPFYRSDVEALLAGHEYTDLHLHVLYWLIWLSLLSDEELLRLLSSEASDRLSVETLADLSEQITTMTHLGLIDAILLREPAISRHRRYYVTDRGLYLYLSAVNPSPPLSITRLVRSYPVERDDLAARLARPHLHLALSELITRLIAEGEPHGYHLVSYQQPWRHRYTFGTVRQILICDAALLIQQASQTYAFLVYIDLASYTERQIEKLLFTLLDLRQMLLLFRRSWPALLILSTHERLPLWAHLLLESSVKRSTRLLSGGMTTLDALSHGVYTPIWYDLVSLAQAAHPQQVPPIPFSSLLRMPASPELAEDFSQQRRFFELLLKEAAVPPPHTRRRLTRYVGDSLQDEAMHVTKEQLEELFAKKRKTRQSTYATALLTLALTEQEKLILTWAAHHPLLDLLTLQTLLHPPTERQAIKPLQQAITRLLKRGLIETRLWPAGPTQEAQQRYLLTSAGLKFIATRQGEPFSHYLMHPKYYKESDDEQVKRQWGTRGLAHQPAHTHGLYTFMRQLYTGMQQRGEVLYQWKSAHEAARWYKDVISQQTEHARPDAELHFAPSPADPPTVILLEYDRATTGEREYYRKFKAYLDYQLTGELPLLVVVTPSRKAAERIRRVLAELGGSLQVVILLERDLLEQGLTLALHQHPP